MFARKRRRRNLSSVSLWCAAVIAATMKQEVERGKRKEEKKGYRRNIVTVPAKLL